MTQQGRYLIAAAVAGVLALAVLGVERAWVTEAEQVEAVVRELGQAVKRSDADAALALMTPDVTVIQGRTELGLPQLKAVQKMAPRIDLAAVNPARG